MTTRVVELFACPSCGETTCEGRFSIVPAGWVEPQALAPDGGLWLETTGEPVSCRTVGCVADHIKGEAHRKSEVCQLPTFAVYPMVPWRRRRR